MMAENETAGIGLVQLSGEDLKRLAEMSDAEVMVFVDRPKDSTRPKGSSQSHSDLIITITSADIKRVVKALAAHIRIRSLPNTDRRYEVIQIQPPSVSDELLTDQLGIVKIISPVDPELYEANQESDGESENSTDPFELLNEFEKLNVATVEAQDKTQSLKLETRVIQESMERTLDNIEAILRGDVKAL